jgi:hypothetical protein
MYPHAQSGPFETMRDNNDIKTIFFILFSVTHFFLNHKMDRHVASVWCNFDSLSKNCIVHTSKRKMLGAKENKLAIILQFPILEKLKMNWPIKILKTVIMQHPPVSRFKMNTYSFGAKSKISCTFRISKFYEIFLIF